MSRARNWCFTLNNYTDGEVINVDALDCRYLTYGKETGDEGTPHLQGYIEFSRPMRFQALKLLIPRAHLEPRQASRIQARDYCHKEDKAPFEKGIFVDSGARTDLEEIQNDILVGTSMIDIADDHFSTWTRYHKSFALYQQMHASKMLRDVDVYLYHGPSGTGKTYKAFMDNPDCYILSRSNNGVWFDGYIGQTALLIDDFCPESYYEGAFRIRTKRVAVQHAKQL